MKFLLDLLWPVKCAGCAASGAHCCANCLAKIERIQLDGRIASGAEVTTNARDVGESSPIAAAHFKDKSVLSELIHRLKYGGSREVAKILACLFGKIDFPENSVLIPVPLHRRRENWRGFNQSELLAQEIAKNCRGICAVQNLLKRHKYTRPQVGLEQKARLTNLHGAFCLSDETRVPILPSTHYFLVDDVCTTGSTLNECESVLRANGAVNISRVVIAKT